MIINNELMEWMDKFEERFNDIVPLRQINSAITNEALIEAIQKCLEDNVNYLPQIYGYEKDDGKKMY